MKFLFANTPQWYPMSPYSSSALLAGQLKAKGFDAATFDFNVEFFNDILTTASVSAALECAKRICDGAEQPAAVSERFQKKSALTLEYRKQLAADYLAGEGAAKAETIAAAVDDAVAVMKDKVRFYEPETLFKAKDILADALDILSLPYAPARIMLDNYIANPLFTYDYDDVKFMCFSREINMFVSYFEEKLKTLDFSDCALIGISITDLSQLIPGLTLARMLKATTKAKICLGGNYIFKIEPDISRIPEIFEIFCDFLSVGDGETAIVELAEHIAGKRAVTDVHSLVYLNESGETCKTERAPRLNLEVVAYPYFDTYDFGKYFSPDIVLPVQLGKGCYWSRCTFCDFYTGQQKFDMKSVKRAADEVEYLAKRYNCRHFTFVDEAVPPKIYNELALEFIRRKLDINYYSFARLENGFTLEVLQNLEKSGGRFFMWGYEAASERIMELMNKGIDNKNRLNILRDARKAGLWNHCTFLLCYPTETPQELAETIKVIYDRELVNSCTPSNFALKKNSILKNDVGSVGITDYTENGSFHISYKYHALDKSMADVKLARNTFERKFLEDTADSLWSLTFTDSDHLLLYLAKFGRDKVFNYRLKRKKNVR